MGDKSAARAAARAAGVPVVPGVDGADAPTTVARSPPSTGCRCSSRPPAGGGGKGMRLVRSLDELEAALEAARREARAAFGDDALLVERYIAPARHIELQVLADAHGGVVDLGERECSLQRRHQKVIEETPSPRGRRGAARDARARGASRSRARAATSAPGRSSSSPTRTTRRATTSSR